MRILSVDDSAIIRKIIKSAAEALGFEFSEAGNGSEALDLIRSFPGKIDLILLDWNMPVKSGIEVLTELKQDLDLCTIPVMMVTTRSEKENIIAAIKAGAVNYITKPFTMEDLITKIMECFGGEQIE